VSGGFSMTDIIPARAAYREWAQAYDHDANKTRDLDGEALRSARLELSGKTVIELGAGTGKNTAYLAQFARQVVALDLSPDMLARARQRKLGAHITFVESDIRQPLPIESASADVLVSNLVLEHIEDLQPVFDEAHRVLKADGIWHLSEYHPFRQMRGGKARYSRDGETAHIEAYLHMIEEYVGTALAADFTIRDLREPIEAGVTPSAEHPPRLVILTLVKG
jgi:ubiquinone/menaquinone biosynthesis C-methylase UbiE